MSLSPSSVAIYNGQSVSFTCPAVDGALTYTWSYGAQIGSGSGRVKTITGVNETLNDITGITIQCTAKDDVGTVLEVHSATLTVYTVPATGIEVHPPTMSLTYDNQYGYMEGVLTTNIAGAQVSCKGVNYDSADDTICTVNASSGQLNAESNGTVNVWVGANSYALSDYCQVTVTGFQTNVPVQGVTLDSTLHLGVGDTYILTPLILPVDATDKSVTWSTNNSSVATVNSSGVVTGVAVGSCVVTARTTDGGYESGCTVTVSTDRPSNWAWSYSMTSGGAVQSTEATGINTYNAYIMSATEWNNFTARLNAFRTYKGWPTYAFTTVYPEQDFTYAIANQGIAVTNSFGFSIEGYHYGDEIKASSFNDMRDAINSVF